MLAKQMMADYHRRLKLAEVNEQNKQESLPVTAVVSSSGEAELPSSEKVQKETRRADSGSSDDVLTISLGKDRKRDKKKKLKVKEESAEVNKRKRVSFSMDKNMTRGKYSIANSVQSSTSTQRWRLK